MSSEIEDFFEAEVVQGELKCYDVYKYVSYRLKVWSETEESGHYYEHEAATQQAC